MKKAILIILLGIPCLLAAQDLKMGDCFTHKAKGIEYCVAADSSTYDQNLGDSYRLFLIINQEDETELTRHYLKVNLASDFAYEFLKEYLEVYKLLVIQGAQAFYLYNIETGVLSDYIKPSHEGCAFSDNQGTYIHHLKILSEGSVLQLEVKECGTRYFDISNLDSIVEIEHKPTEKNVTR